MIQDLLTTLCLIIEGIRLKDVQALSSVIATSLIPKMTEQTTDHILKLMTEFTIERIKDQLQLKGSMISKDLILEVESC